MIKSIYALALLFLAGCRSANTRTAPHPEGSGTIVRDIPPGRSGRPNSWFPLVRKTEMQLGLDALNGGVDSLEIRIWMGGGLAWINHTVLVQVEKGKPMCKLYTYKVNRSDNKPDSLSDISIRPVEVGSSFIDSLLDHEILTLPNGPPGGLDGIQYCIQVATPGSYRFYSYWSPEPGESKASNDIAAIIQLLKRKCNFEQY